LRLLYLIPGWSKLLIDSELGDTWLLPCVIFFGQLLEYPPLLLSILLSIRSNIQPRENSQRLLEEQNKRNRSSAARNSVEGQSGYDESSQFDEESVRIQQKTMISSNNQ
jgi:Tfp pilus assembly protein PilN